MANHNSTEILCMVKMTSEFPIQKPSQQYKSTELEINILAMVRFEFFVSFLKSSLN